MCFIQLYAFEYVLEFSFFDQILYHQLDKRRFATLDQQHIALPEIFASQPFSGFCVFPKYFIDAFESKKCRHEFFAVLHLHNNIRMEIEEVGFFFQIINPGKKKTINFVMHYLVLDLPQLKDLTFLHSFCRRRSLTASVKAFLRLTASKTGNGKKPKSGYYKGAATALL